MKKGLKTALIILVIAVVIGGCIGGYFIWRHNSMYIGEKAAVEIAIKDAGVEVSSIIKREADFEKALGNAWYDVEFETHSTEYDYVIDAVTGAIRDSYSEPQHSDKK